jgi:hypothetical protein
MAVHFGLGQQGKELVAATSLAYPHYFSVAAPIAQQQHGYALARH